MYSNDNRAQINRHRHLEPEMALDGFQEQRMVRIPDMSNQTAFGSQTLGIEDHKTSGYYGDGHSSAGAPAEFI
jgi:hypothetical protein